MKIVQMKANGLMGLELIDVELSGDGKVIEVHGMNGHGKSRFLDIIAVTMGGTAMRNHIKDARGTGETKAEAEVITDDGYTITRKWKKNGSSTLTIFSEENGMMGKPADFLKRVVGEISFDPMSFANMQPRDQKSYLMELCGLEEALTKLDSKKKVLLAEKKKASEEVAVEEKVLARAPQADKSLVIDGVEGEVDIVAKQEEIERVDTIQSELEQDKNFIARNLVERENRIEALKNEMSELEKGWADDTKDLEKTNKDLDSLPDVDELRAEVEARQAHNAQLAIIEETKGMKATIKEVERFVDKFVEDIAKLEEERQAALETADFPIDGLGFDEEGVTYKGIPFTQIAQSERLRIAMRIAIAKNPELKVIRVNDASLLDDESIAEMDKLAKGEDYQFFLELVGGGESTGIFIEEGSVKSVDEETV